MNAQREEMTHVILSIALDFLEPASHMGERGLVRNIVGDYDAMGAPVVGRGDGPGKL